LCLSSNSVVSDGGEGVIELLDGNHSVTIVIKSSHKRVLFVAA
jgi:phage gp45-like